MKQKNEQPSEIQKLMKTRLASIAHKPEAQQEKAYMELAKGLTSDPDTAEAFARVMGACNELRAIAEPAEKVVKTEEAKQIVADLRDSFNEFSVDVSLRNLKTMNAIAPYLFLIDDKTNRNTVAILAEALRMAREDDRSIKPFQADHEIEELETKLLQLAERVSDIDEQAQSVLCALIPLQSTPPSKYISINTAIANALVNAEIFADGKKGDVKTGKIKDKEITAFVSLSYEDEMDGVTIKSTKYTAFDRRVHDAVCSIWKFGHESNVFTPAMVARVLSGKRGSETPSPHFIGLIIKSIEKQRKIDAEIDDTEGLTLFLKSKGIKPDKPLYQWSDVLLSLRPLKTRNGNTVMDGYYIKEKPILLDHAEKRGQLLYFKPEEIDIKELDENGNVTDCSLSIKESRVVIRDYLLKRIKIMQYDRRRAKDSLRKYNERRRHNASLPAKTIKDYSQQQSTILFKTVFENVDLQDADGHQKRRYIEYIKDALNYWKAIGTIIDYSVKSDKTGVEITLEN